MQPGIDINSFMFNYSLVQNYVRFDVFVKEKIVGFELHLREMNILYDETKNNSEVRYLIDWSLLSYL